MLNARVRPLQAKFDALLIAGARNNSQFESGVVDDLERHQGRRHGHFELIDMGAVPGRCGRDSAPTAQHARSG